MAKKPVVKCRCGAKHFLQVNEGNLVVDSKYPNDNPSNDSKETEPSSKEGGSTNRKTITENVVDWVSGKGKFSNPIDEEDDEEGGDE